MFLKKHISVFLLAMIALFSGVTKYEFVTETVVDIPLSADAIDYYFAAYNLKNYGVYSRKIEASIAEPPSPDALRPPGYSLFIYPFVDLPLTMEVLRGIQVAQIALSVLCIPLLFFALRHLIPDIYLLLAVSALAISPHLTVVNVYFLSESLYTFSLVLIVSIYALWIKSRKLLLCLALGATIAISALIRPTSLYLLFFIAPLMFFHTDRVLRLRVTALVVLGFIVLYSPWLVRNQLSDIEPSRSLANDTVQKGMYPGLMYNDDPATFGFPNKFDPNWHERSADMSLILGEVARRFSESPGEHLRWYLIGKPITYLSWSMVVGMGDVFIFPVLRTNLYSDPFLHVSYGLSKVLHWPLTIMALLTSLLLFVPSISRKIEAQKLFFLRGVAVIFGYFILVHMAGTPLPRYSIPIRPILYVLAFAGMFLILKVRYSESAEEWLDGRQEDK